MIRHTTYIAEKIGINNIQEMSFLNMLIYSYNARGRQQDSFELLRKKREAPDHDKELDYWLVSNYLNVGDYSSAMKYVNLIIRNDKDSSRALIVKGDILRLQKHYVKSIKYYAKANIESVRDGDKKLFLSYAGASYPKKASVLFDKICKDGITRRLSREIYIWLSTDQIEPDLMARYLQDKKVNSHRGYLYTSEVDAFLTHVFTSTEPLKDNGVIRSYILKLYGLVKHIKRLLLIEPNSGSPIYHYSRIQSLAYLTDYNQQGASRFRLSNVAYMNDPAEGNIISDMLRSKCGDIGAKEILLELYGDENTKYRRTFLSSFSKKPDFLPMWVQYADNGTGCCYKIPTSLFGEKDSSPERQATGMVSKNRKDPERSVLYQVNYYSKSNNIITYDMNDKVEPYINQIIEIVMRLRPYFEIAKVANTVAGMLDEIRYLFKSSDYRTEAEVRIVETDFEDLAIIEKVGETQAPKLYLQLSFDLYFDEIILGPKVRGVKEWSAYLGKCTNVNKVSVSKIQYN